MSRTNTPAPRGRSADRRIPPTRSGTGTPPRFRYGTGDDAAVTRQFRYDRTDRSPSGVRFRYDRADQGDSRSRRQPASVSR